jgi:hypothetical protein
MTGYRTFRVTISHHYMHTVNARTESEAKQIACDQQLEIDDAPDLVTASVSRKCTEWLSYDDNEDAMQDEYEWDESR